MALAYWQSLLSRYLVKPTYRPWDPTARQDPNRPLTPGQVLDAWRIFSRTLDTPAAAPGAAGKASGRAPGCQAQADRAPSRSQSTESGGQSCCLCASNRRLACFQGSEAAKLPCPGSKRHTDRPSDPFCRFRLKLGSPAIYGNSQRRPLRNLRISLATNLRAMIRQRGYGHEADRTWLGHSPGA